MEGKIDVCLIDVCIKGELRKESTRDDGGQLRSSNNPKYKGQSSHSLCQSSNPEPYNHGLSNTSEMEGIKNEITRDGGKGVVVHRAMRRSSQSNRRI